MKCKLFVILFAAFTFFSCTQRFVPTEWTKQQEIKIHDIMNNVKYSELEDILADLNGIRNVVVNEESILLYETAIIQRFHNSGLQVITQEVEVEWALSCDGDEPYYEFGPFQMNNIIAIKPGIDPRAGEILLTAHWDSVPMGPGIDDNASGCAAVLEAARVLQESTFKHTIKFVIFAFEEEGVKGSSYYAKKMSHYPEVVINLDMIGFTSEVQDSYFNTDFFLDFPRTGDFIGVFATDFSSSLGIDFIRGSDEFVPALKYYLLITDPNFSNDPPLVHLLRSDHAPFWEKGIPAIMITDTAFLRNNHPYHTDRDTIENIDFNFMYNCVKASIATLCIRADIM
ncbi:MAG: M20/M25/M40 family metallo-hydrolase [Spirochaetales bacterium]|nr:M20/M25/M40 family metallo-hydrolase [Spirochaetales bacterium]